MIVATREDLNRWVLEAVRDLGPSQVARVAEHIWSRHEKELQASGDLFYTWQYAMRWEAMKLRKKGKFAPATKDGLWRLA